MIDGLIQASPSRGERIAGIGRQGGVEASKAGTQDPRVRLAEEEGDATAGHGEDVAVLSWEPLDETLEAEAAEVVGHLRGGVGGAAERGDALLTVHVGSRRTRPPEAAESREQET